MQRNDSTANTSQPVQASATAHSNGGIKWFLAIPVLLIIFGSLMLMIRIKDSRVLAAGTKAADTEAVSVTRAQQRAADADISLPSTLQAYSDAPIYARTSGYVAHWFADIGTHVHQGQLLAVIESPEVDQELNQARAVLSQTQANLTLAEITAKRYQELIHTDAVAQQEVDANNQNLDSQKAGLQAAEANVKRLEQLKGFEQVVAPFDGVITQRLTDVGDLINAGNSGTGAQLFRMSKINIIRVFVPVPEIYSDQITDGLKADLELTELPDQKFQGSVIRSSHAIDTGSHTLLTEIDVSNPSGKLMPGAYANVHIHLAAQAEEMTVPTGAVLFQAAGPQVAVVNGKNEVELHKVSLGRDFGNNIEITGGIAPRDQIISSPPDYLVDGMSVTIQPSTSDKTK